MSTTPIADFIKTSLIQALTPDFLEVIDESQAHLGHAGYNKEGSHFAVTVAAPAFANKSLVECHRLIYAALGDKVGREIHALRITIKR